MSDTEATWQADERTMLDAFLDDYRAELRSTIDGLTDEQARRSLVPSLTTLLGLVKHATFVELAWFDEGITFRPRADFGFASSVEESFTLTDDDTIASVLERYDAVCEASRKLSSRGPMCPEWRQLRRILRQQGPDRGEWRQHRGTGPAHVRSGRRGSILSE